MRTCSLHYCTTSNILLQHLLHYQQYLPPFIDRDNIFESVEESFLLKTYFSNKKFLIKKFFGKTPPFKTLFVLKSFRKYSRFCLKI